MSLVQGLRGLIRALWQGRSYPFVAQGSEIREPLIFGNQILLALQKIADLSARAVPTSDLAQEMINALYEATGFPVIVLEQDHLPQGQAVVVAAIGVVLPDAGEAATQSLAARSGQHLSSQVRMMQQGVVETGDDLVALLLAPGLSLAPEVPLKTGICVPVRSHQRHWGTLSLGHTLALTNAEVLAYWLTSLATQMAAMLSYHHLNQQLVRTETQQQHYQQQYQQYEQLLDRVPGVVFQTDGAGDLIFLHPSWQDLTGYSVADSLGRPLWSFVHEADQLAHQASFTMLLQRVEDEADWEHCYYHEARYLTREGLYRWLEIRGTVCFDPKNDTVMGLAGTLTDRTHRRQLEAELLYRAQHDDLTGLPNRLMFMSRLEQVAHGDARSRRGGIAVLFLDLDGFKEVNDTWGHQMGDQLLVAVAQRIEDCIRPGDTLARLGGDEFTVLLNQIQTPMAAQLVCDRILRSLSQPFELGSTQITTSASVGVALSHTQSEPPEALLRQADMALYRAKASGKGCSIFFAEDLQMQSSPAMQSDVMATSSMPPILVIATVMGQTHVPLVGQARWILGRNKNSDILLSDRAVSRTHAEIQRHENGHYYLVDLDSGNGTFVNGNRMNAPHLLRDGDRITLGLTHLKFRGGPLTQSRQPEHVPSPKTVFLLQSSLLQQCVWRELMTSQGIALTVLEADIDLTQLIQQQSRSQTALPDLLILDMTAIKPNPYQFCRWCRETHPQLKIILTSGTRTTIATAERKWALHQGALALLPSFPEPPVMANLTQVIDQMKVVLQALDWPALEQQSLASALLAVRQRF